MMLPVSLANVAITAFVYLWGGREGLAIMGLLEWLAILFFIALSARPHASESAHEAHH